jgi:RNA polymerase sigma factor (sigma-70 family)
MSVSAANPRPSDRRWSLTAEAFGRLLERLGHDPEVAGREYDALHRRLVTFFRLRGMPGADALADEAIDRVARRLEQGEPVEHVRAYVFGIARYILLEEAKRRVREAPFATVRAPLVSASEEAEIQERRAACLEECLQSLEDADRALIVAYYEGPGGWRLPGRRRLAARLGITEVALRTRAHRIRNRLEDALRSRLSGNA